MLREALLYIDSDAEKGVYIALWGQKRRKKTPRTRILLPSDDTGVPAGNDLDEDGDESGMYLEKEDVKLLYNALASYTPTEEEKQLHSIWLEEFEEMLVVEYGEPYPDAN